ncbi:MAG: hypothetical protein ACOCZL_06250 [Bacteroidota bacterium]
MKKAILILFPVFLGMQLNGQIMRAGGGLSFSTGVMFNTIETGNPGIFGKLYFEVFENGYLLPSLSLYNRYYRSDITQSFKNWMFHGDVDLQYEFFHEGPLRVYGLLGGNATAITSNYEVSIGDPRYSDKKEIKPGLNLGAGVEMYIDGSLDSVLSIKYIAGPWDQVVIQLGVYYHFYARRRIGW